MAYSAEDILIERENRVIFNKKLMEEFGMTLLYMRVNYPGINKNNTISNNILTNMDKLLSDIFNEKLQMKLFRVTAEGPSVTMLINDDPRKVKDISLQIEERHTLGRCMDIDIYDSRTRKAISRKDFGLPPRKCFLCDEYAHNCVRSKKHSQGEVIKFINDSYKDFMENFYGKNI